MSDYIKNYSLIGLAILVTGTGAALCLKANVGVDAWDALGKTCSDIASIKIGTMGMFLNCLCFIGQIILLKKQFRKIQLLQIPVSILFGLVINVILYDVLAFDMNHVMMRIFLFLLGTCLSAIGISIIMLLDQVTFALEGLCMAIANKGSKKFHMIRQGADVVCVVIILIVTPLFNISWSIGIGTILGLLILGPLIGVFMKGLKPYIMKYQIVHND